MHPPTRPRVLVECGSVREEGRTVHASTLPVEVAMPATHGTVADDRITDETIAEGVIRLGGSFVDCAGTRTAPAVDRATHRPNVGEQR